MNVWKTMRCRACGKEQIRASNAIFCTDCSPSTTTGLKHQLELLKQEIAELRDDNATLRALVAEAIDFDHAAGCSGGHGNQYRCKCGRREWLLKAEEAIVE